MPWKTDENGALQAGEDGNPIWMTETGEEKPVDYTGLTKRLSEVNNESRSRKEKLREFEAKFAPLADAGVEDIPAFLEEAQKALEMMKNAPDKDKAIDEQVRMRVKAVTEPLEKQIAAKDKIIAEKEKSFLDIQQKFHAEMVANDVQSSKTLNERIAPSDRPLIRRELVRAGRVNEDGKIFYVNDSGETIYGDGGNLATVDEALVKILSGMGIDPATKLLSTSNATGSGASAIFGGAPSGKNPWTKEHWNVTEQMKIAAHNPAEAKRLQQAAGQ